jgi:hypothetical protein
MHICVSPGMPGMGPFVAVGAGSWRVSLGARGSVASREELPKVFWPELGVASWRVYWREFWAGPARTVHWEARGRVASCGAHPWVVGAELATTLWRVYDVVLLELEGAWSHS